MTSTWTSCTYKASEIAKRKCPLDPMDPMDLEMSIGVLCVHWIQWTSGISIGHLRFHLVNYHVFDVMTSTWTSCGYKAIEIAKGNCPLDPMDPMDTVFSVGKIFVRLIKWASDFCPFEFCLSIGFNGQVEFPSDICFFSWSITMYLSDVMTSTWTSCRCKASEIAKRKCPLDPMDPMALEMSIGVLCVHWIQWTSGISIGHLRFHLVNYHVFQ
ncbi:Hypothetical predicted protein [Paramuricea clavata]|uniref:Uncharacterized protein n=1 Tax=Paramuricea clavata TaxID=317549 RepID=A0A6S7GHK3_PARCT|nr:Hypothetical predicted protein [Paramuricea clavata]